LDRWLLAAPLIFSAALIAFSFAQTLWTAACSLAASGFMLLLTTAGANTVLQTTADEDKRGRVVSLYTTMVTGLSPIGGLLAGLAANQFGAPVALRVAGISCLAISLCYLTQWLVKQTLGRKNLCRTQHLDGAFRRNSHFTEHVAKSLR
jgi:MFS family permease